MILKNKISVILFVFTLLGVMFNNTLNAAQRGAYATKNLVGQEYYLKRCSSCHGEGNRGGNMASIREWKNIFSKNGFELIDLHTEDSETKSVIEYLKSNDFKKEAQVMLEFLQEFAYDSEHIPTCY
jgi:hypothetical protein